MIPALSLLFVLSLTACGNSDAALRQENEALRQQILALEAERDNLTKENKDLTEENAALDDTAPESGDDEANPIDRFFEGVDVGSSTAEMNAVADSWAGAWESECRNAAKWLKGQLPLQERGVATCIGQTLTVTLEITQQKGGTEEVYAYNIPVPRKMDNVIINLPGFLAGLPEEAYLSEFIPSPDEVAADETDVPSDDDFGMEDMGMGDESAAQ